MLFGLLRHRYSRSFLKFTRSHTSKNVLDPTKPVTVKFITQEGEEKAVTGPTGQDILTLAHENNVDLEGNEYVVSNPFSHLIGACEGSLACSTCHVILDQESYDKLPEPTDEENDMLDLAFGLTET